MGVKLDQLAAKAADQFLQTAVFIDDGIDYRDAESEAAEPLEDPAVDVATAAPAAGGRPSPALPAPNPPSSKAEAVSSEPVSEKPPEQAAGTSPVKATGAAAEIAQPETKKKPETGNPGINVSRLVTGFARRRILCSAINPTTKENALTPEELADVCAAADIVILDWNLQSDDGTKTKALIASILRQSQANQPHQQRLIVIYTDSPNLDMVGSKLQEHLASGHFTVGAEAGGKYVVGSSAIVVFGKKQAHSQPMAGARMFTGEELPHGAITEFAHLARGIIPSAVLAGLAAVRKNTSKVMKTFGASLDPGFMLHRALVKNLEPAEDHLREVLADELASALEEDWLHLQAIEDEVVAEFCQELGAVSEKWAALFGVSVAEAAAIRERFITAGYAGFRPSDVSDQKGETTKILRVASDKVSPQRPQDEEALKVFLNEISPQAKASSREFAALLSSTRHYNSKPYLTLGTIVKFEGNGSPVIALCLQPVCDALRLKADTPAPFPFIMLAKGPGPLCFPVNVGGGDLESYSTFGKPKDQFTEAFTSPDSVISARDSGQGLAFNLSLLPNGASRLGFTRCAYLCQLKRAQAQRVAERVSSMQSRVGLTESEWLRLQSRGSA